MGKPDDLHAGHYVATATVYGNRRNLFYFAPGKERHIGTLVAGSRSQIGRFDDDCERIVRALDLYDTVAAAVGGGQTVDDAEGAP